MYFGNIKQLSEVDKAYPKAVAKLLKVFAGLDPAKLENKRYDVEGDSIFYIVSEGTTKPAAENRPEAHKRYLDVQFLLEGAEGIGLAIDEGQFAITEDLFADKDIAFYAKENADEFMIVARPGSFTVLYPTDIHRPMCAVGAPGKVRKIVGKVAVSAL
ncbi:MAG: YhcH/YjgK/YiaL family protein [Methylobacteriaceae bacterium]|jgi:YhcH/YjgK/YiaL family protein|nr:YhcH/YjgK/YiaL family protein [Methylobacteriaceae bacterium]